jgi:hypothetical protein
VLTLLVLALLEGVERALLPRPMRG